MIAENITALATARDNIRDAINAKGGTLTNEGYNSFAEAINALSTGGGGSSGSKTLLLMHFNDNLDIEGTLGGITRAKGMQSEWGENSAWTPGYVEGKFGNCIEFPSPTPEQIEYGESTPRWLELPLSTGIQNNDFTIDFWFQAYGDYQGVNWGWVLADAPYGGQLILFGNTTKIYVNYPSDGNIAARYTITQAMSLNTWYHVALVRSATNISLYLDGTSIYSHDAVMEEYTVPPYTGGNFVIGRDSNGNGFQGKIDELRVSNVARWTANFTPPTAPYTID